MGSIDVGVIGLNFGKNHIKSYAQNENVGNIYVLASSLESTIEHARRYSQEFKCSVLPVTDLNTLIKNNPALVSVCTPDLTHVDIGSKLVDNGINVLMEKPMDRIYQSTGVEKTRRLLDLADRKRVLFTEFLPHHMRKSIILKDMDYSRVDAKFVISKDDVHAFAEQSIAKHGSHIQNIGPHAVAWIGNDKITHIDPTESVETNYGFVIHCWTKKGTECFFTYEVSPIDERGKRPPFALTVSPVGVTGVNEYQYIMFPGTMNIHGAEDHENKEYHIDVFRSQNSNEVPDPPFEIPGELGQFVNKMIGLIDFGETSDPNGKLPDSETILMNQTNISKLGAVVEKKYDMF